MPSESSPILTIVVPTYKRPTMLATCLRSIREQSFADYEVLVCDNSEDQEGRAVVEHSQDRRFHYIPRKTNCGIFRNAVSGFQAAQTELVMEVDDDDQLYPSALEHLVPPLLRDPTLALSFADVDVVDSAGRVLEGRERADFLPDQTGLVAGKYPGFMARAARGRVFMMAAVLRKDAIHWDEIPDRVATAYDRFIMLDAARTGRPAYYVDEKVAAYKVHAGADGVSHASSQLAGALAALEVIAPDVSGSAFRVVSEEIVRTRVMLARALAHEQGWRAAESALRDFLHAKDLAHLTHAMVFGYLPHWLKGRRGSPLGRERRRRRVMSSFVPTRHPEATSPP